MITRQTLAFLADLKANNNRDWFAANKDRYQTHLKAPSELFATEVSKKLAAWLATPIEARIFRIHRDIRFSKDKTPYNPYLHIGFGPDNPKPGTPSFMIGIEPDVMMLGFGCLTFTNPALLRWRERIAGPQGETFQAQLDILLSKDMRLSEPELKRVPSPYKEDHPRAALLKRKGIALWQDFPGADRALGPDGPQFCTDAMRPFRPLYEWMRG